MWLLDWTEEPVYKNITDQVNFRFFCSHIVIMFQQAHLLVVLALFLCFMIWSISYRRRQVKISKPVQEQEQWTFNDRKCNELVIGISNTKKMDAQHTECFNRKRSKLREQNRSIINQKTICYWSSPIQEDQRYHDGQQSELVWKDWEITLRFYRWERLLWIFLHSLNKISTVCFFVD